VTGALGVSPHSSVREYLYSCYNNLLINLPGDAAEEHFNLEKNFYITV
jgi:hypothetical protein